MASDQAISSDAAANIIRLMAGSNVAQIIRTAAELGLADHLGDGSLDVPSLARATATHGPSLARILRALAAIGIVLETNDRHYSLTPLGAALRTSGPNSMRASVRFLSDKMVEQSWQALPHAIRTGDLAFRHVFGTDQFTYLSSQSESSDLFDKAMSEMTRGVNASLLSSYPFGNFEWIVDVGGGFGSLLIPILEQNPVMRGTVFELPHVARKAQEHIMAADLASRCEAVGGDALAGVPSGADGYLFKSVILMHEDTNAVAILRNCRSVMQMNGKVILIERLLPERIDPSDERARANLILDLSMLVLNGGSERTENEYISLLAKAGLRLNRTISTPGPQSIIEAVPV